MSSSRDDFGIAIRSALLKKGARQKFSLIFQKYHNNIDNKGFAACTLWFCIIQWINEFEKLISGS